MDECKFCYCFLELDGILRKFVKKFIDMEVIKEEYFLLKVMILCNIGIVFFLILICYIIDNVIVKFSMNVKR